jgi:hypothetical protein
VKIQDVKRIAEANRAASLAKRVQKRADGVGILRGAMSGALLADGKILAAKCPRLDQARYRGVEATSSEDSEVVFAGGFGHENFLSSLFEGGGFEIQDCAKRAPIQVGGWPGGTVPLVLKEQGHTATVAGSLWQGTPDFMIRDANGIWHGLEAKAQMSNYGVHKSITAGWPQRKHILQCANYMTIFGLDEWLLAVGHYFYAQIDGEKYAPAVRWFRVYRHESGNFAVENEDGSEELLDFGPAATLSYLKLILESEAKNVLATRPKWKELFPGLKAYDECNYCPMSNECNRADNGKLSYADWLERLKNKEK